MLMVLRSTFLAVCFAVTFLGQWAEACIIPYTPIETTDLSGVVAAADEFDVAEIVCENCQDEQFTTLTLQSIHTNQSWQIEGYLIDLPRNALGTNSDFFDPWRLWGMPPTACEKVPALRPEGLYDVALKDNEIIWIGRHDPYLLNRGLETLNPPKLSSSYLSELARDMFRSADLFWTCEETVEDFPTVSNALFRSYGRALPGKLLPTYGACIADGSARGIVIVDDEGGAKLQWTLYRDQIRGNQLSDQQARAVFDQALKARFEK
ncbi:MAG: hypothetical protein NXH88_12770 [Hyphomonas sp.]|nr:hypothetical protein [Hyphomonas sp.]